MDQLYNTDTYELKVSLSLTPAGQDYSKIIQNERSGSEP